MDKLSTLLSIAGCMRPVFKLSQRDNIVKDFVRFMVLDRIHLPLEQFRSGLNTLGVFPKILEHPLLFEELFCRNGKGPLTADDVEAIFLDIKFSPVGSNKILHEEKIIGYWRDFLIDIDEQDKGEEDLTLANILCFATGADTVPHLGFHPSPAIEFLHEPNEPFRKANTCAIVLKLPLADTFDNFTTTMIFGIKNSHGFGLA